MQPFYLLTFILFVSISCSQTKHTFEFDDPESHGFSTAKLDTLSAFLEKKQSSAMMLLKDGKVIYNWGQSKKRYTIHSIRKAILNSLIGIEVAKGRIDTNATLLELGIDDINVLTNTEKEARVIDLLKSRSGVYHPAAAVSKGMQSTQPKRGTYKAGEHFYYNNWDFNVLGYILEKQTGKSIYNLFQENIATPLGMKDYHGKYRSIDGESEMDQDITNLDGFYQFEKSKSKYPAYHFRLSARDMLLYGQLYLNNGSWNGKQLIHKSWIEASTKAYSVTNPYYGIGYGMLWYVLMKNSERKTKSFYHTGTGIHMLGIYPASNLVLVHRVDTENGSPFHQGDFYEMIRLTFAAQFE